MDGVETYIVAGPPHSGTSLISGTLHKLGIPMGNFLDDGKFEDQDFLLERNLDKLYDIIWTRNHTYKKWGFKYPYSWRYIPELAGCLEKPKIILAYRDLYSYMKRYGKELNDGLPLEYFKVYGFWGTFLELYRWDLLIIDYEKSIQSEDYLIQELIDFCKLSPSIDDIDSAKEFNTKGMGYNVEHSSNDMGVYR